MASSRSQIKLPLVPYLATFNTMQDQLYYNLDERVSTQENQFFFFLYMARIYEAMLRYEPISAIIGGGLVNNELHELNAVTNPRADEVVSGINASQLASIRAMFSRFLSFKTDKSDLKEIISEGQTMTSHAASIADLRISTKSGEVAIEGIDWGHALFIGTLCYGISSTPQYNKYKTAALPATKTGEIIACFYANCQAYRISSVVALAYQTCALESRLKMIVRFILGKRGWQSLPGIQGSEFVITGSYYTDRQLLDELPEGFSVTPSTKLGTAIFTLFSGFEKQLHLRTYLARVHGDGRVVSNINDFQPIQPLRSTDSMDIFRWNQLPSPHILREEGMTLLESPYEVVELANPDKVVGEAALFVESTRARINLIDRLLTLSLDKILVECETPEVKSIIDSHAFKLAFILCVLRPCIGGFTYLCAGARYLLKIHPSAHLRRMSILVLSSKVYGICIPEFETIERIGVPKLHFLRLKEPEDLLRIALILRKIYSLAGSDLYLLGDDCADDDYYNDDDDDYDDCGS